jgi:hypothetical protein
MCEVRAKLDFVAVEPRLAAGGGAGRILLEATVDCAFVSHTLAT